MTIGTWIFTEHIFFALNDNNGEVRHQNVFSWTPISTRGIPRAKLRPPTYIMGWNEVHRGHASFVYYTYLSPNRGWPRGLVDRAANSGHKGPGFESSLRQNNLWDNYLRLRTLASSVTPATGAILKGLSIS